MRNATNNDELLDLATQAVLDQAPQDVPPADLMAATKATLETSDDIPLPPKDLARSHWFRRVAISATAIAASMMVAISIFMTPSDAFAQVVEQLRLIKTATFTLESTGGKRSPDFIALATAKSPGFLRLDFQTPDQTVNITNGTAGELISYDAGSDQVTVNSIPKASAGFDILQQLQNSAADAVAIPANNSIAGTDLYSIFDGQGQVWVDTKTKLPVQIEVNSPEELGGGKLVYRDFQWDVPVDESLFQLPVGRTIVRSSLLAEPTEAELIAAFELRHAFSQAAYDANYLADDVGLRLGRLAYDLSKTRAENSQRQQTTLRDHFPKLGISVIESQDSAIVQRRIDYLCMKLDQWEHVISRTGGWVGNGVLPGEPKALCWWKDDGKIRVLQGNLSIVDAKQPPQSE